MPRLFSYDYIHVGCNTTTYCWLKLVFRVLTSYLMLHRILNIDPIYLQGGESKLQKRADA